VSGSLKITEIFHSIQGESSRAGRRCVFVRLTACDLRCRWCDTEYAFTEGRPLTLDGILDRVAAHECDLVEITGGEPLLQEGTPELCRRLLEAGYEVLVETGGHRDTSVLPEGVSVILDMKCPGSGESDRNDYANLERLKSGDEVKFVIADRADYEWARDLVQKHELAEKVPVHVSPVFGEQDPRELAEWILADRLDVRLQLQLHKHVWEPDARGV
jgi:7-carboxy-7-deazaguanine synthase